MAASSQAHSFSTAPPPDVSNARFSWRAIFDQAAVGMALVGPTGNWLEVNQRLTEIVGYSRQELLQRTFQQITHPDDLDNDLELLGQVLDGSIESYGMEKRYIRRDGSLVPVKLTVSLVRDAAGEPDHFISVVEDRSKQVAAQRSVARLQRALARQVRDLESANRQLEAFGYTVSHDLRAPLRAIDGFTEMVLEDAADTLPLSQVAHLHRVREGVRQMGDMIQGLLRFSKQAEETLSVERVDTDALVRRQFRVLTAALETPPELRISRLPPTQADPVLLERVWANLLSNAIKFGPRNGEAWVEVGCRDGDEDETVFFVRDNGVGFDRERSDQLFTVFRRLHSRAEYPGQGIGLALSARIVARHGGRIWADSEPGRGATFHFTLGPNSDEEDS